MALARLVREANPLLAEFAVIAPHNGQASRGLSSGLVCRRNRNERLISVAVERGDLKQGTSSTARRMDAEPGVYLWAALFDCRAGGRFRT
jgi:hypothetical protein